MHRFTIRSVITSLAFFGITFLSAAPAHADLDKIQASGKLIVAVYDDFAPFSTKAGGIETATSMHLFFDAGATAFRVTFRMDGAPKLKAAISQAKGSNTLSPFVRLGAR